MAQQADTKKERKLNKELGVSRLRYIVTGLLKYWCQLTCTQYPSLASSR